MSLISVARVYTLAQAAESYPQLSRYAYYYDTNSGPGATDHRKFSDRVQFAKGFVKLLGYSVDFSGDYTYDVTGCIAKDRRTGHSSSNWYLEDDNSKLVCLLVYDDNGIRFDRDYAREEQRQIYSGNKSY